MSRCRCEAKRNHGEHCQLCMGRQCWNHTYEFNGQIYNLVDAVLLWSTEAYDGPLAGIAVYKGFACYAKSYSLYRQRSFWLYPLRYTEWQQESKNWVTNFSQRTDYKIYLKRNPLGFFRINYTRDPLQSNRIENLFQQNYEEFFREQVH